MTKAREAAHTVAFVDEYCAHYRSVFHNVRHFEQFTLLEFGLLAEPKRKSLLRLVKAAKTEHQALHHFLANAEWSMEEVHTIRLHMTKEELSCPADCPRRHPAISQVRLTFQSRVS